MDDMRKRDDNCPQCLGKFKGQTITHNGHVWEWTGNFWKKVI